MVLMPVLCPHCHSDHVIKGGKTTAGQQRYKCQNPDWFCQLVEGNIVTRQTGTLSRSFLSLRQPAPCPSLRPNSQIGSAFLECVPPFTRGVLGHEIGLVLARELRPLVPGHPLPLSSPHRIQWHVCGGRRGQDGCDRAETVCVSCHGDIPGRLCRLLDRTWHNGYPVRSAPAQLSPGVGDAGHALLAQGILPRRCACTVDVSPSDAVAISLSAGFLSQ